MAKMKRIMAYFEVISEKREIPRFSDNGLKRPINGQNLAVLEETETNFVVFLNFIINFAPIGCKPDMDVR